MFFLCIGMFSVLLLPLPHQFLRFFLHEPGTHGGLNAPLALLRVCCSTVCSREAEMRSRFQRTRNRGSVFRSGAPPRPAHAPHRCRQRRAPSAFCKSGWNKCTRSFGIAAPTCRCPSASPHPFSHTHALSCRTYSGGSISPRPPKPAD